MLNQKFFPHSASHWSREQWREHIFQQWGDYNLALVDFNNMALESTFKSLWASFSLPLNWGNILQECCEAIIGYCVWRMLSRCDTNVPLDFKFLNNSSAGGSDSRDSAAILTVLDAQACRLLPVWLWEVTSPLYASLLIPQNWNINSTSVKILYWRLEYELPKALKNCLIHDRCTIIKVLAIFIEGTATSSYPVSGIEQMLPKCLLNKGMEACGFCAQETYVLNPTPPLGNAAQLLLLHAAHNQPPSLWCRVTRPTPPQAALFSAICSFLQLQLSLQVSLKPCSPDQPEGSVLFLCY